MSVEVNIVKAFKGFNLQVEFENPGGFMGILGASGCGKSMTLKCIAGIVTPDKGRIVVDGRVLFDSRKKINLTPQERHLGFMFQNYALFPTMTVSENIASGLRGKRVEQGKGPKMSREEKEGKVKALIARFHLEGLERRYPSQLSGGQQQRVALARMLAGEPDMIMLDEPFSALDGFLKDALQEEMLELLRDYQGDILMVTHSRDEIFKFCQRLTLISDGSSIKSGYTKDIFQSPGLLEAARLTGCKNFSRVERLDAHNLTALDWGMQLRTEEEIGEDITHVAVRGHWMEPVYDKPGENTMRVELMRCIDAPFEQQYLFRNKKDKESSQMWWMRSKKSFLENPQEDFPPYLRFPSEHLMLLRDR